MFLVIGGLSMMSHPYTLGNTKSRTVGDGQHGTCLLYTSILSDLYDLIEEEFKSYDPNAHLLYTEKLLQEVLLGLHSMCKGADAQFFTDDFIRIQSFCRKRI